MKYHFKINSLKYLYTVFIFFFLISGAQSAERLVSLKPNITEILFDLGVGPEVVGVTTYCDDPPEVHSIQKVASYVQVDVEAVMGVQPTLIIGSKENSLKKGIEFLEQAGLSVHLFPFGRLEDISRSISEIGALVGRAEKGNELVQNLQKSLSGFQSAGKNAKPLRALMIVGMHPLVVVGHGNLLDDVMTLVGLTNAVDAGTRRAVSLQYPTFSAEKLVAVQPDVILDLSMGSEGGSEAAHRQFYAGFPSIPAVAHDKIFFLDVADFRPSPRIVDGVAKLVKILN